MTLLKKMNYYFLDLKLSLGRILSIGSLFVLSSGLQAQTIIKTKIDILSGDTSVVTSTELLFGQPSPAGSDGMQVYYSFMSLNKNLLLTLTVQTQRAAPFMLMPDSTTAIVFQDTTGLELHCNQPVLSRSIGSGNFAVVYYNLTKDMLAAILEDKVSKLRISYNGGVFAFDIADDNAQKFRNAAGLLIVH